MPTPPDPLSKMKKMLPLGSNSDEMSDSNATVAECFDGVLKVALNSVSLGKPKTSYILKLKMVANFVFFSGKVRGVEVNAFWGCFVNVPNFHGCVAIAYTGYSWIFQ